MDCYSFKDLLRIAFVYCGFALLPLPVPTQNNTTLLQAQAAPGSELFTNDSVVSIRIQLSPQGLAMLREESRRYVRAVVCAEGKVYREVGVHLKGSTGSFRGIDDKPSLTLDFGRFINGGKFHALRKIHLNNSVEDTSYVNEQIGSELFRAAGVPAPRVTHALVELDGRSLGLYVLKEGFTEDFLRLYFHRADGNLYDSDWGHDVDERMRRVSGRDREDDQPDLKVLAEAALEPELSRRWQRLQDALDVNQFITFMVVEVMICHRDGYCLARNNFRIYGDPETKRMVFFPHGMDQLFGKFDMPWKPYMAGIVARAVMETAEGRQRFEARFSALFANLFVVDKLTNRVNQIVTGLRPYVGQETFKGIEREAGAVRERIVRRRLHLRKQLDQPDPALPDFKGGVASLSGWMKTGEPDGGSMDEANTPDGVQALHIVAGPKTSASWRTTIRLGRGRYRFEARARISAVEPLPFGRNQGAGLRVAGRFQPPANFTGDSPWTKLEVEFPVDGNQQSIELVCELRASAGEAWFDVSALRLVQIH